MKTVLGIDLGTQSLKVLCYDYETQQIVGVTSAPLDVDRDKHGKAEQDAQWWLSALLSCCTQLSTEIKATVQAIAVSGQQHGFVPLDKTGKVLAPVKLWCDTATQTEALQLSEACGGKDEAIALTGNPVLTGYTAPKILWLRKHHPDLYAQLAHILLPHDYLNFVLTGVYSMEFGDASGTGLLDVKTRTWSKPMLTALDSKRDLTACLPPLYQANTVVGKLTAETAQRYGLPAGVVVATGGGDNMMGAIGTGNVTAGKLTISLGSSGTLYAFSATPVIDPQGNIAAFCSSSNGWLPLLCTMNCTLATEQMRKLLDVSLAEFDALAASVPPGSDGLLTLPFFNGERTPDLPTAKACLLGMDTHNTSKAHVLRSTMEACTYALKFGCDEMQKLGLPAYEIIVTGGGSKSAVWRQLLADVFQLPVKVLSGEEGACFGAALQALWVLQLQQNPALTLQQVCTEHIHTDLTRCAEPDTQSAAIYTAAYNNYQRALQQLTPLFDTVFSDSSTEDQP